MPTPPAFRRRSAGTACGRGARRVAAEPSRGYAATIPRLVLLDWNVGAQTIPAAKRLVAAGASMRHAHAALSALLEGVPAYVDVERPDSVAANLSGFGIEAEIIPDDGAETAA